MPFEHVATYTRRAAGERFTPAMLAEYSLALGIDAFNKAFYGDEAQLISYATAPPARQCRIEEMRREYGLE